ncbi:MAG: protein-glutamate O-methyltransferase CheR [Bacteroidia bacterium]|nr:protein-glutamate O-methyltransferase CheR [Bacteroidia bacterium]
MFLLNEAQIDTVLKDLLEVHLYDFTFYSRESFKRRINRLYKLEKYSSFQDFRVRLRSDETYIDHFIDRITVNVTEMFRDHSFFKKLRTNVIPELAQRPLIRIWCAGCSTGEEVYSVAMMLHEAGVLNKSEISASDINPRVLNKARKGYVPSSLIYRYANNYTLSGGEKDFFSYFTATEDGHKISEALFSRIRFFEHSLAKGAYFHKYDLILCRNVLIYFDRELQDYALQTFDTNLSPNSYIALGEKETLKFSRIAKDFDQLEPEKIWRKK